MCQLALALYVPAFLCPGKALHMELCTPEFYCTGTGLSFALTASFTLKSLKGVRASGYWHVQIPANPRRLSC